MILALRHTVLFLAIEPGSEREGIVDAIIPKATLPRCNFIRYLPYLPLQKSRLVHYLREMYLVMMELHVSHDSQTKSFAAKNYNSSLEFILRNTPRTK